MERCDGRLAGDPSDGRPRADAQSPARRRRIEILGRVAYGVGQRPTLAPREARWPGADLEQSAAATATDDRMRP
jgi:hypothetical protein